MKLTVFDTYADLLKEKSGLSLTEDKSYLLESRLAPIAKKWNHPSVESLASTLKDSPSPQIVNDIVEAMTTNETFFFRDTRPFDIFKSVVVPYMREKRAAQRQLKIWAAAASSGQEPYSIAMILQELSEFSSWNIDILGTDISKDILEQAKEARYTQFEAQRGLPIQLLMNYFTQNNERWDLNDVIKRMVRYEQFNLLDSPSRFGTFDVIFCRNVLIYFDAPTKTKVFQKLSQQLSPDGFLFLGGAETVLGLTDEFKPVPNQRGLYAKAYSVHITG